MRQLLKLGGFSPTGRNRPAHELLLRALKERGEFHHINNAVDVNNLLSLEAALPISIFDASKLAGAIEVRVGEPGEGYVFNASGQYLDVKRCIVCCAGGQPVGSPVKDSLATKVFDSASHFAAVLYAPAQMGHAALAAHVQAYAQLLVAETGGQLLQQRVVLP